MKKTAKEMFKELGWKCVGEEKDNDGRVYEKDKSLEGIDRIIFYREEIKIKKVTPSCSYFDNVELNIEELQAINKQVEELGWGEQKNEN